LTILNQSYMARVKPCFSLLLGCVPTIISRSAALAIWCSAFLDVEALGSQINGESHEKNRHCRSHGVDARCLFAPSGKARYWRRAWWGNRRSGGRSGYRHGWGGLLQAPPLAQLAELPSPMPHVRATVAGIIVMAIEFAGGRKSECS
jgi:hypothetical protein